VNLLHSEWIKLLSTRTTWVMIGVGLLCEGLFAGLLTGLASFNDIGKVTELITGLGLLMTLMLVLGVLIITTEFRHGTTGSTFLVTPRRWPVMLAKLGACLLIGVVAGLLFVLVNGGLALSIYSGRGGTLPPSSEIVDVYLGVVVSFALLAAFGLGIGAIVRNQVGAIITLLAWGFVVENLLFAFVPSVGRFAPVHAQDGLFGLTTKHLLSPAAGAATLVAWTAALAVVGAVLAARRDVS